LENIDKTWLYHYDPETKQCGVSPRSGSQNACM